MNHQESSIKRIMLLTHERGREMGREEVLQRAKNLITYLRNEEGVIDADLDYALLYWQELLENE